MISQNHKISSSFYCALILFAFTYSIVTSAFAENDLTKQLKPLRVAVAANFTPTLKLLQQRFSQETGIKVQLISGSSGNLFQQIKHGAPFDLFISADTLRPQQLIKENLTIKNYTATYAYGTIAFWSASWRDQTSIPSINTLISNLNRKQERLAIANPKIAPYGKAAKQYLEKINLWNQLTPYLITGININQTFQQVYSQAIPLGIIATSQLKTNNLHGVIIPSTDYQAIEQQMTILNSSQQLPYAKAFFDFILSTESQRLISQNGYTRADHD